MSLAGDRILTREEAQADLADALKVVKDLAPPDDLRAACFNAAVQLCTMRGRAVPQVPVGMILGGDEHLRQH